MRKLRSESPEILKTRIRQIELDQKIKRMIKDAER